jgi:predicted DNA-binding protein with PD1-like motif
VKFTDYSKGYVIKLEPGEEFQETLGAFAAQKRIPSASFQGIGALTNVELGYFSIEKNDYERHSYGGNYELLSASGNISVDADVPVVHTHVMLSDEKCHVVGGHLFEGIVSITAEVFLFPMDIALIRKADSKLNFKGLDLPHLFVR